MTGFYVGETYVENNVFHYFKNRVAKIVSGKIDFLSEKEKLGRPYDQGLVENITQFTPTSVGYLIDNQDTKNLKYPDSSIDYIFTDPPYGDSVPYFEQSIIWNTWLNKSVDYKNEVVISDSKLRQKNSAAFETDIAICIREIWRVLKTNCYFSITFHSISGEEWYALVHACLTSGFELHEIEWLTQKTFAPRQLNRKMTIKGDLLVTFIKNQTPPRLTPLGEIATSDRIIQTTHHLLKSGPMSTNSIYVNLLTHFFSNHILFSKVNFIEILSNEFNVDENGMWFL